jgi:hypothetical protein
MNNINIDSIKLDICNFEQIHNYIRSILWV